MKLFNEIATAAVNGAFLFTLEPVRARQFYSYSTVSPTLFMGNYGEAFKFSNWL